MPSHGEDTNNLDCTFRDDWNLYWCLLSETSNRFPTTGMRREQPVSNDLGGHHNLIAFWPAGAAPFISCLACSFEELQSPASCVFSPYSGFFRLAFGSDLIRPTRELIWIPLSRLSAVVTELRASRRCCDAGWSRGALAG